MKAGPDIAMVAALVGDPARANMLTALMTGRALTASELAHEAGVTPQTASSHLATLGGGGLIEQEKHARCPLLKSCLVVSDARHHPAGPIGAALMTRFPELKWAARDSTPGSRVVN